MVERCLFRVHRHFLTRNSEFFRGLFACPVPPGEDAEGRTDANPIVLYGVTTQEFRCLLRFFYDSTYSKPVDTLEDWIALLSIATRYVFDRIRELAIIELSRQVLDPVHKITLANQYDVSQWLPIAFTDLMKRPEPITEAEAESLGMRNVVRVARGRELAREKGYIMSSIRSYYPYDKVYTFNDKAILQIFYDIWPECAAQAVTVMG
ncbi:hypothetical protein PHLGIDRAFT_109062 [Phlebiopsis gigantea 11061_1 CR5-6]|uniref:BTB domain-containing protein n=1 Tax=Phlebiopsis gigantea (strain 11061_1 CR5-6) TaxID=745531 RepID=A0A0C3S462_PHLG1|nr:hypothetical protein PHLGIDRAFT_109062 [Phlebiopsis gigantea 11061_1 CR5-6]